jgi:hypothetical protein
VTGEQLESLFFRPAPESTVERATRKRQSSDRFRPPRVFTERAPYHMGLASVLPARTLAIQQAGRIVFHVTGDTGGVNGTGAQQSVADYMARQIHDSEMPDQPSFFYHLGDVVYYHGENELYHDQFYYPYQEYPAPIFAIPGNHDGDTVEGEETLSAFHRHFCAAEAVHDAEAGHSSRPTMTQPNGYWRLEAPFVTIVGLYSNVSGELDNTDRGETTQLDWLTEELRSAPQERCLLVAVHHPLYSLGKHGGTQRLRDALQRAMTDSGRTPDAIFTAHDHCYQRFTLQRDGREVPVIVAGAGGFAGYDDLTPVREKMELPEDVKLEAFNDTRPGFLRLSICAKRLKGEYFTVPRQFKRTRRARRRDRFVVDLRKHVVK